MESEIQLGSIAGLRVSARPSFFATRLLLLTALVLTGRFIFKLSRPKAVLGALIASVLDPIIILIHQLGHAWAAKRTGWPMIGISFWSLFSTCIYPSDEPELSASVHLRRAVGGPVASFLNGLIIGIPALWLLPRKGVARLLALFWVIDACVVRSLLALGPVSWSDGPPVRYWARRLLADKNLVRNLVR